MTGTPQGADYQSNIMNSAWIPSGDQQSVGVYELKGQSWTSRWKKQEDLGYTGH